MIIPASNVRNLMLGTEVVDAVAEGRFHVWAVRTIDEALGLLTGERPGRRHRDGSYAPGTVHGLVQARLAAYGERMRPEPADGEPPDAA